MKPPGTASGGTLTRIVLPFAAINSKDPPGTAPTYIGIRRWVTTEGRHSEQKTSITGICTGTMVFCLLPSISVISSLFSLCVVFVNVRTLAFW